MKKVLALLIAAMLATTMVGCLSSNSGGGAGSAVTLDKTLTAGAYSYKVSSSWDTEKDSTGVNDYYYPDNDGTHLIMTAYSITGVSDQSPEGLTAALNAFYSAMSKGEGVTSTGALKQENPTDTDTRGSWTLTQTVDGQEVACSLYVCINTQGDTLTIMGTSFVASEFDAVVKSITYKEPQQSAPSSFKAGTYEVGDKLPAGEYILVASGTGYYEITSDTSGSPSSVLAQDVFNTYSYVTVSEGQYIRIGVATAYPVTGKVKLADLVTIKNSDGTYKEGMYKVGVDIDAGEYLLKSTDDGTTGAYYEVDPDSSGNAASIISNGAFDEDTSVTVVDGEYLKVIRATVTKVQ